MTTRSFDIERFDKNKNEANEYSFISDDSIYIRQTSTESNYIEYATQPDKLFEKYYEYDLSGNLKTEIIHFSRNFIKLEREYNESGDLIKEIDYDEPFKFSFRDLQEMINKEKDAIDLYDKNTTIGRSHDSTGTFWYVTYKRVPMRREVIKVDGITGEIVERSHHPHEDN